jgi:hypothetical protein
MKPRALSLAMLILLSVLLPTIASNPVISDEFELYQQTVELKPGLNESTAIPHLSGYRVDSASLDWQLNPEINSSAFVADMVTYHSVFGNSSNLTIQPNGLMLNQSTTGPSTAGNNSLHLFNNSNLQGFHSYNVLQLSCGITSCGSITATANLTIHANKVIIDSFTSINGDDLVAGNTGVGSSEISSKSWAGNGAGGAGHTSAGGNGGGSSTNGGSSYGTGAERGSAGGSNSHPTTSSSLIAAGGAGGVVITIVSGSIIINGSVTSDGGDGDNGPTPPSGGNGGNGAGGGSGGSIILKANTISVGQYGEVSSIGGDGGDGHDAVAPSGPSIGMYHGGDGGGGGSGGFVKFTTMVNGLSNSGTVDISAGSGGAKGVKYGTGSDGIAGVNSGVGNQSSNTFSGFNSSGNSTTNEGRYQTDELGGGGEIIENAWLNSTVNIPAGSILELNYNYTLNGDDWSGWLNGNITHQVMPRFSKIILRYDFQRSTGGASPTLNALELGDTDISHMENLTLELEGQTILGPTYSLGNNTEGGSLPSAVGVDLWIDVPLQGEAVTDLWLWLEVEQDFTGTVTGTTDNGNSITWTEQDVIAGGIDLNIPKSMVQASWPTNLNTTHDGMDWGIMNLSIAFSNLSNFSLSNLSFHHTLAGTIDITAQMVSHALATCGSWYASTPSCLSEYQIESTGDGLDEMWNQTLELSNLNIEWVDDIEPQIQSVSHKVGGVDGADARIGESIVVIVKESIADDTLQGRIWVHQGQIANELDLAAISFKWLIWESQIQGYWASSSTTHLNASQEHDIWISVELTDAQGNTEILLNADSITVLPAVPSVVDLIITTTDGESADDGEFSTPDNLQFTVEEANNRSDLNVEIELDSAESTHILTMIWNDSESAYVVDWEPDYADLGYWTVEVLASETDGGMSDSDGLVDGIDANFTIGDGISPVIISGIATEWEDEVRVDVQWTIETGDSVNAWLFVLDPDGEVVTTEILQQSGSNSGFTTISTTNLNPGPYNARIHISDLSGNEVNLTIDLIDIPEPAPVIHSTDVLLALNGESIILTGNISFRTNEGTLTWFVDGEDWSESDIGEGMLLETLALDNLSNSSHEIILMICSMGQCENYTESVNATPWWTIKIQFQCIEANCTVENIGESTIPLRITSIRPSADFACSTIELEPGSSEQMSCGLNSGMAVGDHLLEWHLEAQQRSGNWLELNSGTHTFTIAEPEPEPEPKVEQGDDTIDESSQAGLSSTTIGIVGLISLLLVALIIFSFVTRKKSSDTNEMIDLNFVDEIPLDQTTMVDSYQNLPGGGQYHERDDGTWYETPEGDWWWQHPDGKFEKV